MRSTTHQQDTALFVAAFFDELVRWGVRDVVVSPGSRSTALSMAAFELSRRRPSDLRLYVDVDERGAAFLALGMAKASGRPTALVCTSGTALANYYPAVIEAETSRVPLVVLSGDRPPQLQGLGAPQTTDQLKAYGDHVRSFRAMPLPGGSPRDIDFARQAAREACIAALGSSACVPAMADVRANGDAGADGSADAANRGFEGASDGVSAHGRGAVLPGSAKKAIQVASRGCETFAGPVHLNFPFDLPLKPDFEAADIQAILRDAKDCFGVGRKEGADAVPPMTGPAETLSAEATAPLESLIRSHRTVLVAGEGSCSTLDEAKEIMAWARAFSVPVWADPLSGLRSLSDPLVIDNYDNLCDRPGCPNPELVIRFGRYPVSKRATTMLDRLRPLMLVVDVAETRDFNAGTDGFVGTTPLGFVRSPWTLRAAIDADLEPKPGHAKPQQKVGNLPAIDLESPEVSTAPASVSPSQLTFAQTWISRNDSARDRILSVDVHVGNSKGDGLEGAYLRELLHRIPEGSCLFSANSMAVRAVDTFYTKRDKPFAVLANRGQNGIDGVVSTAIGASRYFGQTTFLAGDFTLLHDLNALALQRELLKEHGTRGGANGANGANVAPSLVIVLLNNNGGAIFDMLPQASEEPYFERLFLAPQDVDFQAAAAAFAVPSVKVDSVAGFVDAYERFLGTPGISLIEVTLPLRGVADRYAPYQS